jgi:hypothetical protein
LICTHGDGIDPGLGAPANLDSSLLKERVMDDWAKLEEAKRKLAVMKGFYIHLFAYIAVNIVLLAINLLTTPAVLWFQWPLLGWGIGVAVHAFLAYGRSPGPIAKWEDKKLRELMK